MRDRIISQQVRILLERMDTHPEEFCKGIELRSVFNNKWDMVITTGAFNWIEKYLIRRKLKKLKREATQQQILMTIMYGEDGENMGDLNGPYISTPSRFDQHLQKRVREVRSEYDKLRAAKNTGMLG